MANYNKIILVGNLTRDPQLSYLPSQTPVVEFGLAVNRKWKDQSGQPREEVCFIDCRAYARSAETINQYLRKGSQALIEGRLQFDQWTDKDGNKRSKHRIFVEGFQFLDGRPAGQQGQAPGGQARAPQAAPQAPRQTRQQGQGGADEPPTAYDGPQAPAEEEFGGNQDNIPF